MKRLKLFLTALILLAVLCGCTPPLAELHIPVSGNADIPPQVNQGNLMRKIYVSGAVENDGYINVPQICDYNTLLQIAGALPCAYMRNDVTAFVPEDLNVYIVDYVICGVRYYSHNVNSLSVKYRLPIDGVDGSVVDKLADYIDINGAVSNRQQLKDALGDDYLDNYYKFFIEEQDYAQDS